MIHGNLLIEQGFLEEEEEMEFNFCFFCTVSGGIISLNGIDNWDNKEDFAEDYKNEAAIKTQTRDLDSYLSKIDGLLKDFEEIKFFKDWKNGKT